MGTTLAFRAFDAAHDLPNAPARLLVFMAMIASDSDATPVCFAGRDKLAYAAGLPTTETGYRRLRKLIRELIDHGLIAQEAPPAPGRTARYRLTLPRNGGTSGTCEQFATGVPEVPASDRQRGYVRYRNRGTSGTATGVPEVPPELTDKTEQATRARAKMHPHETNAIDALTRIHRERVLPLPVPELLEWAYRIDRDPWVGYKRISQLTEAPIVGARDPAAVLRARLHKAAAA